MKRHKSSKSVSGWLNMTKDGVPAETGRVSKRQTIKRNNSKEYSTGIKNERRTTIRQYPANNSGCVPWCIKYSPTNVSQLAVHKKKIQEVQQWLQFALTKAAKHPILLLTGPSGCGKTATIQVLSKELGYTIIEWSDPMDSRPRVEDNSRTLTESSYSGDWELYESQTNRFLNFITRANRYPTLQLLGGGVANGLGEGVANSMGGGVANHCNGKIVLIEEFPNVFIRDPKRLHQLLKDIINRLSYPLVFIVSESQHSAGNSFKLFPPSVIHDLDIHHIRFNPVARTSTVKTLQRISDTEALVPVNKSVLESIADCCIGDIRAAINILQFTAAKDSSLTMSEDNLMMELDTGDKDRNCQLVGVAGREHPLFLFRALGKILYHKRDNNVNIGPLPPHLSHQERPELLTNPEEVYESAHLSTGLFTSYLHQNYIDFFDNIEEVDIAIGYLSNSDVIGHVWNDVMDKQRSLADSCSCSVSCRGLIFANQHRAPSSKWRPLYKPKWSSVHQQYINNTRTARDLFVHLGGFTHSHLWMPIDLLTELLPYMAFNNIPLKNQSQISLLHTLTTFRNTRYNYHEQLGETEQDDVTPPVTSQSDSHTDDGMGMSLSQQQSSSQTEAQDEVEEIQDFDD